jgi:hypothetical protein
VKRARPGDYRLVGVSWLHRAAAVARSVPDHSLAAAVRPGDETKIARDARLRLGRLVREPSHAPRRERGETGESLPLVQARHAKRTAALLSRLRLARGLSLIAFKVLIQPTISVFVSAILSLVAIHIGARVEAHVLNHLAED